MWRGFSSEIETRSSLSRQDTDVVAGGHAAPVEFRQQLLLIDHLYRAIRARHIQGSCSKAKVLAQRFSVAVHVEHTHWPERRLVLLEEIFAAEVKEGDVITHSSLDIGDQG